MPVVAAAAGMYQELDSFPGLPTIQVLIVCIHFCILQAIKNWTVGRPGNEATLRIRLFDYKKSVIEN